MIRRHPTDHLTQGALRVENRSLEELNIRNLGFSQIEGCSRASVCENMSSLIIPTEGTYL